MMPWDLHLREGVHEGDNLVAAQLVAAALGGGVGGVVVAGEQHLERRAEAQHLQLAPQPAPAQQKDGPERVEKRACALHASTRARDEGKGGVTCSVA